jgi:hypothetical protein
MIYTVRFKSRPFHIMTSFPPVGIAHSALKCVRGLPKCHLVRVLLNRHFVLQRNTYHRLSVVGS